jgi:hypothetical protein
MPRFRKEVLSQFFRTECPRQLRLNLSPDKEPYRSTERTPQGMPPVQPPRPGLELIAQEGEQWQAAKLHDLTQAFGTGRSSASRTPTPAAAPDTRPRRSAPPWTA